MVLSLLLALQPIGRQADVVTVKVDVAQDRHPISALIYGANFATPEQAKQLNLPIGRYGGNAATRYNWKINATSSGSDWFFLSHPEGSSADPAAAIDGFVKGNREAGTLSMVTIPLIGWAAKLGENRSDLSSFSVAKYGPAEKTAPGQPDQGNGKKPDGSLITGNDPNDANMPVTIDYQRGLIEHLVKTFGTAEKGGVGYYLLDNEPSLWQETHRDVFPVGLKMDDLFTRERDAAKMAKAVDPTASVCGPEEWGWPGYLYSGYDLQWRGKHGYDKTPPDREAHGNVDEGPWLLRQFAAEEKKTGKRLLDVFTVHYYPQGIDESDSEKTQLQRNRCTRSLWDPNYVDESWIKDKIALIPRLKGWVHDNYPGTKIGITEYNFGAEKSMSGAVAQADALGIFGREGVDLATRWVCPPTGSPAFMAMQMFRNYDGHNSGFGDTSVRCQVPDPDSLSAFASEDSRTHRLLVVIVNKDLHSRTRVELALRHFGDVKAAKVYRYAGGSELPKGEELMTLDTPLKLTLQAQSITLLELTRD